MSRNFFVAVLACQHKLLSSPPSRCYNSRVGSVQLYQLMLCVQPIFRVLAPGHAMSRAFPTRTMALWN